MKSPFKLAVIVATKNRSQLLSKRALASIALQTSPPDLLIVSDDSDIEMRATNRELVESIDIHHCQTFYIWNQRTKGACGCWNTAVDLLLSYVESPERTIVAFLDDDDAWNPSYLETCKQAIYRENLDMVAAGIARFEDGTTPAYQGFAPENLHAPDFLIGNPGIQGSNLFLRLSTFLEAGGFDEALSSATDRDLCIRLAELDQVRYKSLPYVLVDHYAESDRQRLSSPGSFDKLSGLTTFWQKYQGRMSIEQQAAYVHRASSLFGWSVPEEVKVLTERVTSNKALIIGVRPSINLELLAKIVEIYERFKDETLVGLDVVFHVAGDIGNHTSAQVFTETLRDLGIGCFTISEVENEPFQDDNSFDWLISYCKHVSSLRPGSEVWILECTEPVDVAHYEDLELLLAATGAKLTFDKEEENCKLAAQYRSEIYRDIHQQRISSARHRVVKHFGIQEVRILGSGSEAVVFTDGVRVFKCIDYWKTRTPDAQYAFLQNAGSNWIGFHGLYALNSVVCDGSWVLITYAYEASTSYSGGAEADIVSLLNDCTQAGIVCNNIHPKNLVVTRSDVKLIDYGSDIRPWNEQGYEHMVRRAYLSCRFAERVDLKKLMYQALYNADIPELIGLSEFRAKLDYPIERPSSKEFAIDRAPEHELFDLIIGVITADPIMLLPLLSSLRVLSNHGSITKLSIVILSNGCNSEHLTTAVSAEHLEGLSISIISEQEQDADAKKGFFGQEITHRPKGQLGIAIARTMLQRYLGEELVIQPNSIGWLLDDDMRLDVRARDYIRWLAKFRAEGVDVLLGAYEGASPNPPLNGLRVQLMDLVHNLVWLAELPEASVLPDRSNENIILRKKFPDYYYDLSRKHTAHLEAPLWIEPSYEYETVREARARLVDGALGILNGTPLTRSIVAPDCETPLSAARESVNRGGCTFILNPDAVLHTPNLIPKFQNKEARRSDMIWAIINRYCRGMSIKAVGFPVRHVGRTSNRPTINAEKVQAEIIGSALYAGLTDFLKKYPDNRLFFSDDDINWIYNRTIEQLDVRLRLLKLSFYRIKGLVGVIKRGTFSEDLARVISCIEQEFSFSEFEALEAVVKKIDRSEIALFINRLRLSAEKYKSACEYVSCRKATHNAQ